MSSCSPKTESSYSRFARDPNDGRSEHSYDVPMTMIDRDGSKLYENDRLELLLSIVSENDTSALEQYLIIAPWAVPSKPPWVEEYETSGLEDEIFFLTTYHGYLNMLRMLLGHCAQGEDATTRIRFSYMRKALLNDASRWGHPEMVRFLLENQPMYASIHERDPEGETAILSATNLHGFQFTNNLHEEGFCLTKHEAVVHLLLDWGACATDGLFRAIDGQLIDTVLTLSVRWAGPRLIKRIIDSGADVHGKVAKGYRVHNDPKIEVSALYSACIHANIDAVKTLIECRGVNVDAVEMIRSQDCRGCFALHWATQFEPAGCDVRELNMANVISIIKLLLDIDPSTINAQDHQGNTPLHHASGRLSQNKQCAAVFETLFMRGADGTLLNNKGETPLHTLLAPDPTSILDPLEVDTAAISAFLLHGMKVTDSEIDGNTPLHIAARQVQHFRTVSYLLQRGGTAALYVRNAQQDTPAHIAARADYWIEGWRTRADDKIEIRDAMLRKMVQVGGDGLMDWPNAEGKSPRQLCQEKADEWREAEKGRDPDSWITEYAV
ncbi:ankyrin protein [Fusarium heterosporum]|uniref:Ankyrin protein n=1 Tax=Fusarium heterosporum TaxID=42747 RepID=A0A8H5WUQ7_FUSHE|nr:ankyrin protein [Fusarium heterosporum]